MVNVAPLVSLPATARVAVGEELVLDGWFADPGDDTWTATADTGEGHAPLALDGRGFRVTETFDSPGNRAVEVRVCDGTECGSATTLVTVSDRLAARIAAPDTATEGDEVTLDARGSIGLPDDADDSAYAWDLDGDGAHDDATGPTTVLPVPQDGPYAVALRVTDADGESARGDPDVEVGERAARGHPAGHRHGGRRPAVDPGRARSPTPAPTAGPPRSTPGPGPPG